MLKERTEFIRNILYVIDLFTVTVCFFLLYFVFFHFQEFYLLNLIPKLRSFDLYLRGYWTVRN